MQLADEEPVDSQTRAQLLALITDRRLELTWQQARELFWQSYTADIHMLLNLP
ncbi:MAG: hypothetical protein JO233_02415 [Candidatus Eremiobacteraeota bacterium]|nr:hypothetical protein [Candidatus Eremiobacteraeota bacterium]